MIDEAGSWFWGQRVFCASRRCVLHVTAQSPGVQGRGQWASVDGILYDRHSMGDNDGPLYCSACRRVLLAEHEAGLVRAATAEARADRTEQAELFASTQEAPGSGAGLVVTDSTQDAPEAQEPAHV